MGVGSGDTHVLHDGVDLGRAALGCLHLVAFLYVLHHVAQRYPGVGHSAKGIDLPQQDTEAPHV